MVKDKVLLEISYDKLIGNTDGNFDGRSDRASDVRLTNTVFIPHFNDNMLEIKAESQTKNGKYTSRVIFQNVIFKDDEEQGTSKIITPDGSEYYFKSINRRRGDVKVSCSCLDFYWRFASFNHRDNALASDPPKPYVKKTDRPPVNPKQLSGVCKHLIRLVDELEKDNMFSVG
jgi:hypothetical protein